MSRKRKKDKKPKKRRPSPQGFLPNTLPDVERCVVAAPAAEEEAHILLRDRVYSRDWWLFFGFESETRVVKSLKSLQDASQETERATWPVVRIGEDTGSQEDTCIFLFAKKDGLSWSQAIEALKKHKARGLPDKAANRDIVPLSWGYVHTLMNLLDNLLKQGAHVNN